MDGVVRACARSPHRTVFDPWFVCRCCSCLRVRAAQTVSPQIVEFDPSADHDTAVNGVDVVEGYELRFYAVGGSQPLHVIEIGKPAPQSDGRIRFNFASRLGVWPVGGVVYEARVAAVGPGGSTASTCLEPVRVPRHDAPAGAMYLHVVPDSSHGRRGCGHWQCWRDGRNRLPVDGGKLGHLAVDYRRQQRLGQRHYQLQCGGQYRIVGAIGDADGGHEHLYADAERGERVVRVLVLPDDADGRNGRDDRHRRCNGGKHVRVDGVELGLMVDDARVVAAAPVTAPSATASRPTRASAARSATIGIGADTFTGHAERIVRLHREPHESGLQPGRAIPAASP